MVPSSLRASKATITHFVKRISKTREVATNDKDNLKILKEHYTTIFNRKVPTDLSVLDEVKPMHIMEELGKVPTKY